MPPPPRTPAGHDFRPDIGERITRYPDRADRLQLGDLGEHRVQAEQLRDRAGAGESKSVPAAEFGTTRQTVYNYLRAEPVDAVMRRPL
ncbi:hypothetical protein [Nocardia testacea]|uniref:hypothetical protein n=1 Tax=Nocardia testacea TaxID=248551 RepID=UPI003408FFC3